MFFDFPSSVITIVTSKIRNLNAIGTYFSENIGLNHSKSLGGEIGKFIQMAYRGTLLEPSIEA